MALAVSLRIAFPVTIGDTSLLALCKAMRREAETNLGMPSGNSCLAIAEAAVYNKSAVSGFSKAVLKCSYLHPKGPFPKSLGEFRIASKNGVLRAQMAQTWEDHYAIRYS